MGWTHLHKPRGMSPAAFLRNESWPESYLAESGRSIVAQASAGGVVYFALKTPASDYDRETFVVSDDGTITTALVYLTSRGEGSKSYYNFGYKDLCETMGPCESTCPDSILRLLSPIRPEAIAKGRETGGNSALYAQEWRDRCAAYNAERKAAVKLAHGMLVRLPEAVRFTNGQELDSFKVVFLKGRGKAKRVVFEANGFLYRLPVALRRKLRAA